MPRPLVNVYAPAPYLGMREVSPQFEISHFDYVYDGVISASGTLSDQKSIDPDADFIWEAVTVASSTGTFDVRFADSRLYYLSDTRIASGVLTANDPYPIMPALIIPAGGRITLDFLDTSAAQNTVQLVFRGAKRYRIS